MPLARGRRISTSISTSADIGISISTSISTSTITSTTCIRTSSTSIILVVFLIVFGLVPLLDHPPILVASVAVLAQASIAQRARVAPCTGSTTVVEGKQNSLI